MNHKQKKHLANKLRSREEIKKNVPIFQSTNWESRKQLIAKKVENKIKKQYERKIITNSFRPLA
jgi:hypothetical protein